MKIINFKYGYGSATIYDSLEELENIEPINKHYIENILKKIRSTFSKRSEKKKWRLDYLFENHVKYTEFNNTPIDNDYIIKIKKNFISLEKQLSENIPQNDMEIIKNINVITGGMVDVSLSLKDIPKSMISKQTSYGKSKLIDIYLDISSCCGYCNKSFHDAFPASQKDYTNAMLLSFALINILEKRGWRINLYLKTQFKTSQSEFQNYYDKLLSNFNDNKIINNITNNLDNEKYKKSYIKMTELKLNNDINQLKIFRKDNSEEEKLNNRINRYNYIADKMKQENTILEMPLFLFPEFEFKTNFPPLIPELEKFKILDFNTKLFSTSNDEKSKTKSINHMIRLSLLKYSKRKEKWKNYISFDTTRVFSFKWDLFFKEHTGTLKTIKEIVMAQIKRLIIMKYDYKKIVELYATICDFNLKGFNWKHINKNIDLKLFVSQNPIVENFGFIEDKFKIFSYYFTNNLISFVRPINYSTSQLDIGNSVNRYNQNKIYYNVGAIVFKKSTDVISFQKIAKFLWNARYYSQTLLSKNEAMSFTGIFTCGKNNLLIEPNKYNTCDKYDLDIINKNLESSSTNHMININNIVDLIKSHFGDKILNDKIKMYNIITSINSWFSGGMFLWSKK